MREPDKSKMPRQIGADGFQLQSGVTVEGMPMCVVVMDGKALGYMTPSQALKAGVDWIRASQAAEQNAAVMSLLQDDLGMPLELVSGFLAGMRQKMQP